MTLFERVIHCLAALWICSSVLAVSLDEVILYTSSTKVQLGQQVTFGAKTTASAFMSLAVTGTGPGGISDMITTETDGVKFDRSRFGNATDSSGSSDAFDKACINGPGMDVSVPFFPTVVGTWSFGYWIQFYSPATSGNLTQEDGKTCLSQPMNVTTQLAGAVHVEVTASEGGITSLSTGSPFSDAPTATSASAAFTAGTSNLPFNPSPTSSSTRRFEAKLNGIWSLSTFVTLSFTIWSGMITFL